MLKRNLFFLLPARFNHFWMVGGWTTAPQGGGTRLPARPWASGSRGATCRQRRTTWWSACSGPPRTSTGWNEWAGARPRGQPSKHAESRGLSAVGPPRPPGSRNTCDPSPRGWVGFSRVGGWVTLPCRRVVYGWVSEKFLVGLGPGILEQARGKSLGSLIKRGVWDPWSLLEPRGFWKKIPRGFWANNP